MKNAMINRFFVLLVVITCSASVLDAQVCQWMKQSEGNLDDETVSSVTDAAGNTYLVGTFDGVQLTFGSTSLVNPAGSIGNPSAFIVKYDPMGDVLWAQLLGGGEYDAANSITMDAAGNLYVYGNFYNPTVTFGSVTLTNASAYDNFLVKLNTSGTPIWAIAEHESAATFGQDYAIGVVADDSGHIIVTGAYDNAITIGGIHVAASGGQGGVYVAKYDTAGTALWATTDNGPGSSFVNSIATDGSDNIYIAGYSNAPTLSFDDSTITNVGGGDFFVTKYSPGGAAQWARDIVDSCYSSISDIDADNAGNLYVVGGFYCPTITFDAITLTNEAYAAGAPNAFVMQYNTAGAVNWAEQGGGATGDMAFSVDVFPSGYGVVGGAGTSTPSTFGSATLAQPGLFLATYTSSGAVRFLASASAPNGAYIGTLSNDASGNLYGSGYFDSTLVANGHSVTDTSTLGDDEIFTANFTSPTLAVKEVQEPSQLSVYPNPATTQLTVASAATPLTAVVITDMLGREMYTNTPAGNTTQLQVNIASYPAGVYLARINGTEVRKFVKE